MTDSNALRTLQTTQGAVFEPAAMPPGLPVNFGDSAKELTAARDSAALFDLGGRTQLELTGADRQKFLHNFCTNEVRNLQPGQSCEAFLTTIQGKIKAHLFVFADERSLWIDATAGSEDLIFQHLNKYLITEDVELHRRSAEFVAFYATGPHILDRLAGLGLPVADLGVNRHVPAALDSQPLAVRRVDWLAGPGCLIQVAAPAAAAVWKALTAGGLVPAGQGAFDALRISACFPEHGLDLTADNLAQEAARTNLAVSFSKGCYLGQEPIARIDSMGHVNQELRGLRLASGPLPVVGAKVLMPGEVREAGTVTSVAWDATTLAPVALAMLKRNYVSPGTKLNVVCGDQEVSAMVFGRP